MVFDLFIFSFYFSLLNDSENDVVLQCNKTLPTFKNSQEMQKTLTCGSCFLHFSCALNGRHALSQYNTRLRILYFLNNNANDTDDDDDDEDDDDDDNDGGDDNDNKDQNLDSAIPRGPTVVCKDETKNHNN